MTSRRELASSVADYFDREACVLFGRATTGLALAIEAMCDGGDVIFPAYTCPSAVYSCIYGGAQPKFCDVRASDYNLDSAALEDVISTDTDAVVAVHLFGHPLDLDPIATVCEEYDVKLIEDACHAIGTSHDGPQPGSGGDVSLVSFNDKKPIDAGHGGAILTDNSELAAELREREKAVPVRDQDVLERMTEHYRRLYYAIEDYQSEFRRGGKLFEVLPEQFRPLYMQGFEIDSIADIEAAMDGLEDEIRTRRRHAGIYRSEISHPAVTHPSPLGEPSYYRYSVRMPSESCREHVVSSLRDDDFHASTLYYPIDRQFGGAEPVEVATRLSLHTINLWVDSTVSEEYVRNCASAVDAAVAEFRDADGDENPDNTNI
ncbi:DegT/DnrJ/EryC1/StrS family aminotransferase [Halorientalis salina]|uniref:DegT/DnrJ/EryC1/StrS family aminotransferase n=1 Tax=Halorientalis salina TaxID=2932266 RepID=UPI0010ACA865|nr:DegT/DnrJ/EryC1/StrS family aminotransferase [Halorientalis salina]